MVGTGQLPKFGENLYRDAEEDYWWVPTTPGLVIVFMALGMNMLGDALRDVLDPHLRGR